jgi:hypothetical protein
MKRRIPYAARMAPAPDLMTRNIAVDVAEAAAVKRKARPAKTVVTQLPQRLQIEKMPTAISRMVVAKAKM